ncbi:MAG: UDP-N-acetylmuramoyl-tripeptide--D-alanyl-D-alanine ligase [Christensenella sp.]
MMKEFLLSEAVAATGGVYHGEASALKKSVRGVVIDNRKIKRDFLFVPIKGDRFDGHDFITAAMDAGALCCITEHVLDTVKPYITVENSLAAFQKLAEFYKGLFNIQTIGITGSAGKTTTKEMISSVLSQKFNVLKSEGNLNNQTGVPLTVFRLEEQNDVAVVEMGTNHFGEIRNLAKIARPNLCFITNIGEAHIEHLGSKEGILRAKTEMLEFMKMGGSVFVNGDDPYLKTLKSTRKDVLTFGLSAENDIYAKAVVSNGLMGTDFTACTDDAEFAVHVPSPGVHMVYNALAAIAAGRALGMTAEEITAGIAEYLPIGGRMCIEKKHGITVLNDVYNANPDSMRAALDVLGAAEGDRVCILGDMLELGENAEQYHKQIGEYAAKKADKVLCVGALAKYIYEGAHNAGARAAWFAAQGELLCALSKHIKTGDTVLIKGSRGMNLEHTVDFLLK